MGLLHPQNMARIIAFILFSAILIVVSLSIFCLTVLNKFKKCPNHCLVQDCINSFRPTVIWRTGEATRLKHLMGK